MHIYFTPTIGLTLAASCLSCRGYCSLEHIRSEKEKKNYAGSRTPASNKEKETHWPEEP